MAPYDWATFLHDRIDKINPHADLAGIEQGGYKLVYKDKPSATRTHHGRRCRAGAGRRRLLVLDWLARRRRRQHLRRALERPRRQGEPGSRRKDHCGGRANLFGGGVARRP